MKWKAKAFEGARAEAGLRMEDIRAACSWDVSLVTYYRHLAHGDGPPDFGTAKEIALAVGCPVSRIAEK